MRNKIDYHEILQFITDNGRFPAADELQYCDACDDSIEQQGQDTLPFCVFEEDYPQYSAEDLKLLLKLKNTECDNRRELIETLLLNFYTLTKDTAKLAQEYGMLNTFNELAPYIQDIAADITILESQADELHDYLQATFGYNQSDMIKTSSPANNAQTLNE